MKQGDIVTIAFPFSDLTEKKLRPALVLSNGAYNRNKNVVLAGIYGKKYPLAISITNDDLVRKKLRKESFISLQNIFSVEKALIGKSVDSLTKKSLDAVLASVRSCF